MPNKVDASHILVKTEQEANVAYYDVTHGKSFEDVAKEKSSCPSKKKGGSLGWFGRNQMVKEFETAAFSLKKGEMSKTKMVFEHAQKSEGFLTYQNQSKHSLVGIL